MADYQLDLPSGRKVSFRVPTGMDRANVMSILVARETPGDRLMMELALALPWQALTSDNGTPPSPDFSRRSEDWSEQDIQFYGLVYREVVDLSGEQREQAKQVAKSLRGGNGLAQVGAARQARGGEPGPVASTG